MQKSTIKTNFSKFVKVKIRSFEDYNDDLFNTQYLVNDAYIVRAPSLRLKEPLISYHNEQNILDLVADLDITEKILFYSPNNGFKIARYIKTSKVFYQINDSTLLEYLRLLKKIQKIEINTLEEFNPRDVLDVYKSKCNESDYLNSNTEEKILSAIETDKCEKVVSQSYVEKETIKILENKVKIIDFRFASMNSPFFDIAYFSNSFNLNEKQDKFLLTKYFGYKLRTRYFKLIEHYKKYINLLRYYRNCYYYTISGEVVYLDIKNELKNKISNI